MNAALRGMPVLPYDKHPPVNAGASSVASFRWLNADQEPEAPASLRYRIDNLTDFQNIVTWTAISPPAITTDIAITPASNTMTQTWRDKQLMQVTAEATMTGGTVQVKLYLYDLIAQIRP